MDPKSRVLQRVLIKDMFCENLRTFKLLLPLKFESRSRRTKRTKRMRRRRKKTCQKKRCNKKRRKRWEQTRSKRCERTDCTGMLANYFIGDVWGIKRTNKS